MYNLSTFYQVVPSTHESETDRSLRIQGQPNLQTEFQDSQENIMRTCLKTKQTKNKKVICTYNIFTFYYFILWVPYPIVCSHAFLDFLYHYKKFSMANYNTVFKNIYFILNDVCLCACVCIVCGYMHVVSGAQ